MNLLSYYHINRAMIKPNMLPEMKKPPGGTHLTGED
jgi:hypothetical protein